MRRCWRVFGGTSGPEEGTIRAVGRCFGGSSISVSVSPAHIAPRAVHIIFGLSWVLDDEGPANTRLRRPLRPGFKDEEEGPARMLVYMTSSSASLSLGTCEDMRRVRGCGNVERSAWRSGEDLDLCAALSWVGVEL